MESSYSYIIDYHAKIKIAQRVSNCLSLFLYFLELLATAKKQALFFLFFSAYCASSTVLSRILPIAQKKML